MMVLLSENLSGKMGNANNNGMYFCAHEKPSSLSIWRKFVTPMIGLKIAGRIKP